VADVIAHVSGVALVPGVSKNGRLYTPDLIGKAVKRAQARLAEGGMPITSLTHHAAGDDSSRIVGKLTSIEQDEDGRALYKMAIADTAHSRDILNLIDTKGGEQFLSGVSIRGAWLGPTRKQSYNGQMVETGDDLEIDGLDFTKSPGVDGANVQAVQRVGSAKESDGRALIFESLADARVQVLEGEDMERSSKKDDDMEDYGEAAKGHKFSNGQCECMKEDADEDADGKKPYGSVTYADPGYQDDKVKRYPVDTAAHVRSAWSYINSSKNASKYDAGQLKRIKSRIISAAKKFGIKIKAQEGYITTEPFKVEEGGMAGHLPGGVALSPADPFEIPPLGGFAVVLNNRYINVCISSHLIDPADLPVVGDAAMKAANAAIAVLDPDCDGDIDVPGMQDGDEDEDAMGGGCTCSTGCSMCSDPHGDCKYTPGNCPCCCGGTTPPVAASGGYESAPQIPSQDPEATPAAESNPESEEPGVSEQPTNQAAESTAPAVESAPSAVEQKLDALTAAITGLVEKLAAPAPAAESAPAAEQKTEESAPAVEETTEQRIERLVQEKLTAAVQEHVENNGVQRKGLVAEHAGASTAASGQFDYPEGWPQKPLHQYTAEEQKRYWNPQIERAVLGRHSVWAQES
jgi:hypothetical protein